jgi:hypothetical protein
VSNHLAIGFLLDHIGSAITFVPSVGLGVDERSLDCEFSSCSSHPKAFSFVEGIYWTCGLFYGILSKSRWTPSQASSPCHPVILRRLDIAFYALPF